MENNSEILSCGCGHTPSGASMEDYEHDPFIECGNCGRRGPKIPVSFGDLVIRTSEAIRQWNSDRRIHRKTL